MDQRTRKLMNIRKVLYPRDDMYRLKVSRNEERRKLKDCGDTSKQEHVDFIKKNREI